MRHGSDWYKREPTAYLGGVQGLTAKEHAVYSVVLELIYQHGGSVNNDPAWIAGWISDMGSSAVRKAILSLVERGKLTVEGDQLTQKRAKTEAKTKENLRETREKHGRNGGIESGKSRSRSNENSDLSEANTSPREDKRREDNNIHHFGDFDEFWKIVPKKVGKGQARKAYKTALKKTDAQTLLSKMTDYAESRLGQDATYTKNPATWLNGECWEDEIQTNDSPEMATKRARWQKMGR